MPGPGIVVGSTPPAAAGWMLTLALVANLLIAPSLGLAVAPVSTSRAMVDGYDLLPSSLRSLLGDADGERGPFGTWLASLYGNALARSPKAQLTERLDLAADLPLGEWVPASEVNVTWGNYGAPLEYRVAVSEQEAMDGSIPATAQVVTMEPRARVALPGGESWLHVQAFHDDRSGPVQTLGPFLSDPDPPPAPLVFGGAPSIREHDYHFLITWQRVTATSGIAAYIVERLSPTGWETVARTDPETTSFLERNRPNGDHTYRVRAESGAGLRSDAGTTSTFLVTVDARANLEPPGFGQWHFGFNVIYDSLLYAHPVHEPHRHVTVDALQAGTGGMSRSDYNLYTGGGRGISLDNLTLRQIVADTIGAQLQPNGALVGGDSNTLTISLKLFEWLFDATDYDFTKLDDPQRANEFLRAHETLDAGGGICGDLTALYVTMLRIAGVPARPVHGYLINEGGAPGQAFETIGGFHMWAEVFVGGAANDAPGGGWIPVDVSGVTGSFDEKFLHAYFGVANPNYLQLGIQHDLGDESLGDDHRRNRWNVWANLEWTYSDGGAPPLVQFTADAQLAELSAERGRIWFTPETGERVYCPGRANTPCQGDHRHYFDQVKGRSVRTMDYGANLDWTGTVQELRLTMRTPEGPAPTQVAMWSAYEYGPDCAATASGPQPGELPGTVRWTIPGDEKPCSP